jgi:hypothetical protein
MSVPLSKIFEKQKINDNSMLIDSSNSKINFPLWIPINSYGIIGHSVLNLNF